MDVIRRYGLFFAGALVILASVVWFIVGLLGVITQNDDDVTRFVAPGSASIRLEPGKTYTLFFEYRSILDGQVYQTPPNIPVRMKVTESVTGRVVNLQPPRVPSTYTMGGREGRSVTEFQVDRAGLYTFEVSSQGADPFVMVVGDNFVTGTIGAIFGVILRLFGGLLAGGLIIVITLLRRRGSSGPPPPVSYARDPPPPPR